MQNDITFLIIGTIIGFISGIALELLRNKLEINRLRVKSELDSSVNKEENFRKFLIDNTKRKISPAWLRLVKTPYGVPFFQKGRTQETKNLRIFLESGQNMEELDNPVTINKFVLSQTQVIGRQADCEIQILDTSISRLHALLRFEENNFVIYDLGSKSGTYVNGKEVAKDGTILNDDDKINTGDSVFIFEGTRVRNIKRIIDSTTRTLVKNRPTSKGSKKSTGKGEQPKSN